MICRIARHTNDLNSIKEFYQKIMGFDILGEFTAHNGYDGVFMGIKDLGWHLEFTRSQDVTDHSFDDDDILVFYPQNNTTYRTVLENIDTFAIEKLEPKNPYWKINGIMIKDPDGYHIIVSELRIKETI